MGASGAQTFLALETVVTECSACVNAVDGLSAAASSSAATILPEFDSARIDHRWKRHTRDAYSPTGAHYTGDLFDYIPDKLCLR